MVVAARLEGLNVRRCIAPCLPTLTPTAAFLKQPASIGGAVVRRLARHAREARPRINARSGLNRR